MESSIPQRNYDRRQEKKDGGCHEEHRLTRPIGRGDKCHDEPLGKSQVARSHGGDHSAFVQRLRGLRCAHRSHCA